MMIGFIKRFLTTGFFYGCPQAAKELIAIDFRQNILNSVRIEYHLPDFSMIDFAFFSNKQDQPLIAVILYK
jgi:hypothetical protein